VFTLSCRSSVSTPSLSVFFPAYNDAPSLPPLIEKTFAVLGACASDYEVIVINDGSQDRTGEVLAELASKFGPRMRVITHPRNLGYGQALRSGFSAATKEMVFYTDGDGQYDVGELPNLLTKLRGDVGLVNGYKLERNDPWHRICIGNVYNAFARSLFRIRLRDVDCDFRLIRRSLLQEISLTSTSGTICVELVRKLELSGCGVVEIGVHHYPRLHGRSQFFRVKSLAVTFTQLARMWFRLVPMSWLRRTPAVTVPASLPHAPVK
jgi:glycosyltransferase involved in cell wall biosynthesis